MIRTEVEIAGLAIEIGNVPIQWGFELDSQKLDDVLEVAVFGTIDSPVEIHILRLDREAWVRSNWDDPRDSSRSRYEYQESYYGRLFARTRHYEVKNP